LVDLANELAARHRVDRCSFVATDALALDWRAFDGVYLYNPFAELLADRPVIDAAVRPSLQRYRAQVAGVEAHLAAMPAGPRAATYHGFGGEMPVGWHVVSSMRLDDGALTSWIKTDG